MEYLLNMSLSGSLLWLLYLLIKFSAGERLSDGWRYVLLKCTLLYFLVPIPFIKKFYGFVWERIIMQKEPSGWGAMHANQYGILYFGEKLYLNQPLKMQILLGVIWLVIVVIIFARKLRIYLKQRLTLIRCLDNKASSNLYENYISLQKAMGLKRKIVYIDSTPADPEGNTAFTLGLWRPIILLPAKRSVEQTRLILEHELQHVKSFDILWRILLDIACILHCCNPLVWLLAGEFEAVGEMVCDAKVLKTKGAEERAVYAELLMETARKDTKKVKWSTALSRQNIRLKERVEHVLNGKQKYLGRVVSAMLIGGAVFLNSFTSLAYDDVQIWRMDFGTKQSTASPENFFDSDWIFVPEEGVKQDMYFQEDSTLNTRILYAMQFVDKERNISEIKDGQNTIAAVCGHQYINGTEQEHTLDFDGKCTVITHSAQRCTKCGNVILGEELYVNTCKPCPH